MPKPIRQVVKDSKKTKVLDRITTVDNTDLDLGLKICIYGRSGTGKTTLSSTFPKQMLVVVCSGAGETRSIKNTPGIDAVTLNSPEELKEIVEFQRETNKYKTISLDHVTGFQDLVLKKIMDVEELPAQMGWGTASMAQWGELGLAMKELLRDFISLTCNVVIVSQEKTFNEEADSEILKPYVNTALSPSVTGWLGPNVDYLVQSYIAMGKQKVTKTVLGKEKSTIVEKPTYYLRTGPHPTYATKFRLPRGTPLPDTIMNPSYNDIMKLINGGTK